MIKRGILVLCRFLPGKQHDGPGCHGEERSTRAYLARASSPGILPYYEAAGLLIRNRPMIPLVAALPPPVTKIRLLRAEPNTARPPTGCKRIRALASLLLSHT